MRRALAVLLLCLAGCGQTVDVTGLPSIDGYQSWGVSEAPPPGYIPGHGDSVRTIYANDVAKAYPHGGRYPYGTVLVKEVRSRSGSLGDLVIMRKVANPPTGVAPYTGETYGGWLFTVKEGSKEETYDLCWNRCHRAGPWDGAWFDYGQ
jgi:hypothetical protein